MRRHLHLRDPVADRLELADLLAERLALRRVGDRLLDHGAEDPGAHRGDEDALVVQRREDVAPALVDLADHVGVRHVGVVELHLAGADAAHAELRDRPRDDAVLLRVDEEERLAARRLLGVRVGRREQEQVVGDVGHRRPDLGAVDPEAVAVGDGRCDHPAEQVGAGAGLGDRDRGLHLALDELGDQLLLEARPRRSAGSTSC